MSFFPGMFVPPTNASYGNTYVMQTSNDGETIIYSYGPDGQPQDWACGNTIKVLRWTLAKLCPTFRIVSLGPPTDRTPWPWAYGFFGADNKWANVVKILNGKGINAGKARARLEFLLDNDIEIPYVAYDGDKFTRWILTETGKQFDADHGSENPKNNND